MSTYLLLRNNKESGPHSLGELINKGLKPYDLVWVEGKSAAWRYPGEIEELKAYAPAVEEQPYDRFFKKPSQSETIKPSPVTINQQYTEPVKEKEDPYSRYMPSKTVAVTMPASSSRVVVQKPAARTAVLPDEEKRVPAPTPVADTKAELDVKFSQPLDDIKKQYIKTLQDRKQRADRQTHLFRYAKIAAIIIGLIGSGVIAGYFLSGRNETLIAAAPPAVITQVEEAADEAIPGSAEESAVTIPQDEIKKMQTEILPQEKPKQNSTTLVSQEEIQKETNLIVQQQKKEKITKDKNSIAKPVEVVAETNILNGDRNKKVRDNTTNEVNNKTTATTPAEEPIVKKSRKINPLDKYVSVSANNYIKVAFGGIRNLELTVTNDSKFVLDNVTVELQYMKPSEQPLRTEMIEFHTIAPNESITKRIQDTNRGIKVNYKIVDISSVQSETASAGF